MNSKSKTKDSPLSQPESPPPTKVLYIAGAGRSGRTLLGQILGSLKGVFFAGEVRDVWQEGLIHNRLCGCGRTFGECVFWSPVSRKLFEKGDLKSADLPPILRQGLTRKVDLALMLSQRGRRRLAAGLSPSLPYLKDLYRSIQAVSGSRLIIDSSKFPSYGFALSLLPSIDLKVLQMVRDPRAVAFSFGRHIMMPDPNQTISIPRFGAVQSALRWNMRNLAAEKISTDLRDSYMLIRYEDFVDAPQQWIANILKFSNHDTPVDELFHNGNTVVLRENHAVWGNPRRFKSGTTLIQIDDEWKTRMRSSNRKIVQLTTRPLRRRYGYRGPLPYEKIL